MVSAIWLVVAASLGLCLGIVMFAVMTMAADQPEEPLDDRRPTEALM
jgi:hypothetical protein